MADDIHIEIGSSFTPAGFDKAIEAVNELKRHLSTLDNSLKGGMGGVARQLTNSLKNVGHVADATGRSVRQVGVVANRAAKDVKALGDSTRNVTASMQVAQRAGSGLITSLFNQGKATRELKAAKEALKRSQTELNAANKQFEAVQRSGTATVRQKEQASRNLARAEQARANAERHVASVEREVASGQHAYNVALQERARLLKEIERQVKSGEEVDGSLAKRTGVLNQQIDAYEQMRGTISGVEAQVRKLHQTMGAQRGRISQAGDYGKTVMSDVTANYRLADRVADERSRAAQQRFRDEQRAQERATAAAIAANANYWRQVQAARDRELADLRHDIQQRLMLETQANARSANNYAQAERKKQTARDRELADLRHDIQQRYAMEDASQRKTLELQERADQQARASSLARLRQNITDRFKAKDAEEKALQETIRRAVQERKRIDAIRQREEIAQRKLMDKSYIAFDKGLRADNAKQAAANIKLAADAARQAAQHIERVRQALQGAITFLNRAASAAINFAHALANTLNRAIATASNAIGRFGASAASKFASLRHALDGTGRAALIFGSNVQQGMNRASNAIQRTAAGFSLLLGGQVLQRAGTGMLGGFGMNFDDYMEYERLATRAAVAGTTDMSMINQLVFGLQRGEIFGQPYDVLGQQAEPIKGFSAQEIAQGAYFLVSALGLPLESPTGNVAETYNNMLSASQMLNPMLQVASFTRTSPETFIKGGLNVGMEFGFDPRNPQQSGKFAEISALLGYLANISTMEVPDITESFKMMGPLIHDLTGASGGEGLTDAMAAIFFASEVGIKGGNVGRGLDRALSQLLHPSQTVIDTASKAFGIGADEKSFKEFFFDEKGFLEGGLTGFIEKIMSGPQGPLMDQFLASMFTQNATRSLIGITSGLGGPEDFQEFIDALESGNYQKAIDLFQRATLQTNETIFGSWQDLKNAWFELQVGIVDSIKGPLIAAFGSFADAVREIADLVTKYPILGKLLAGITAAVGAVLTAVGAFLSFAGVILILQRAFLMTGGAAQVLIGVFTAIPHILALGLPILIALAAAGIALYTAWNANLGGVQDLVRSFGSDFVGTFESRILPTLLKVAEFAAFTGKAFSEFVNGILLGIGKTSALKGWLESVFGPLLGNRVMGALEQLSDGLDKTRDKIVRFFQEGSQYVPSFQMVWQSLQAAMEEFFLGISDIRHREALSDLGSLLGIQNLGGTVLKFAREAREALEGLLAFGRVVAQGFGAGIVAVVMGLVRAVQFLVRQVQNADRTFARVQTWSRNFLGVEITLERIGTLIGFVFGALLTTRLLMAIGPLRAVVVGLLQIAIGMGEVAIKTAVAVIQFGLFLARIVISTAALVAHLAILAAVTVAKIALTTVSTALALAQTGEAAASGLAAAATALFGAAAAPVVIIVGALLATLVALPLVLFGLAAAMVVAATATNGWLAGLSTAIQIAVGAAQGFWAVAQVVLAVGVAIGSAVSWFLSLVGVGNQARAVGIALGASIAALLVVFTLLATVVGGVLLGGLAALVGTFAVLASIILAPLAAIGLLIYAIYKLLGVLGLVGGSLGFFEFFAQAFDMIGRAASFAADQVKKFADAIGSASRIENAQALVDFLEYNKKRVSEPSYRTREQWENEYEAKYRAGEVTGTVEQYVAEKERAYRIERERAFNEAQGGYTAVTVAGPLGPYTQLMDPLQYAKYQLQIAKEAEAQGKQAGQVAGKAVSSGYQAGTIKAIADSLGLGKWVDQLFTALGVDPNNPTLKDIDLTKVLGLDQMAKIQESVKASNISLGPEMDKLMSQMEEYAKYRRMVEVYGQEMADAYYRDMGMSIPTAVTATTIMEALGDDLSGANTAADTAVQDAEALAAKTQEIADAMSQASQTLMGLSLPQAINFGFNGSLTSGRQTLAGGVAQYAEQIIANIEASMPEGTEMPAWIDQYEIIADVVGMGGGNRTMNGRNLHKAIKESEGAQRFSRETGVTIDEMLKDVPMYIHDENLLPITIADLMTQGLATVPAEVYQKLDYLGAEFNGVGLKYADLAEYAISQAMAGKEWNLADFVMQEYDMNRQEAEDYIKRNGLNPNIISDAMFPNLDIAVMTSGGKVNALTPEWWDWFQTATKNGTDMVVEIGKDAYNTIPEQYRQIFSALGAVFIVGGQNAAQDAATGATAINEAFKERYGKPILSTVKRWTDEFGNEWVSFTDKMGEHWEVPAPEYDAYLTALRLLQSEQDKAVEARNRFKDAYTDAWRDFFGDGGLGTGNQTGGEMQVGEYPKLDRGTVGAFFDQGQRTRGYLRGYETSPAPPGLPDLSTYNTYGENAVAAFMTGMQSPVNKFDPSTVIDLNTFGTLGTDAAGRFMKHFTANIKGPTQGDGTGGPEGAQVAGPFDSVFEGYATTAATAFSIKLGELLPTMVTTSLLTGEGSGTGTNPFDTVFQGYGTSAATAFQTAFETAMGGWSPMGGTPRSQSSDGQIYADETAPAPSMVTIDADITSFNTKMLSVTTSLLGLTTTDWAATLDLTMAEGALEWYNESVLASLDDFNTKGYSAELSLSGADVVATALGAASGEGEAAASGGLLGALTSYATSWQATISESGATDTYTAIDNCLAVAQDLEATWTATVSVIGADTAITALQGVLNALNAIPASKTVTIYQNTVTSGGVPDGGADGDPTTPQAMGGFVRSRYQMVGELGPELVRLPLGSYVHTAGETSGMFREWSVMSHRQTQGSWRADSSDAVVNSIEINFNAPVTVREERDLDEIVARIDRALGQKQQRGVKVLPSDITAMRTIA